MTGNTIKPYLLQAFYTWCIDYAATPMVEVSKDSRHHLPAHLTHEEILRFDINPNAINDFVFGKEGMTFEARFGSVKDGIVQDVFLHYHAVTKIFAKETGEGLNFSTFLVNHNVTEGSEDNKENKQDKAEKKKTYLQLVKNDPVDKK